MNNESRHGAADQDDTRNLNALHPMRRDYVMLAAPWAAGATDVGRRHHLNQDAIAMWADPSGARRAVLVVSDGVSSAPHSERASQTAANTMVQQLSTRLAEGIFDHGRAHEIFSDAFEAANQAVLDDGNDGSAVGSCTLVVAVIDGTKVAIANIGDTRAYWLPDQAMGTQLSVDDSVAQAQMELGMSREEAETSIHAHAITKWLGPEATDLEPRTITTVLENAGWLMVCSDGLWNYCSEASSMATLVGQMWGAMPQGGPEQLAGSLVGWANQQGGRDNVSVCIARLEAETARRPA